MMEFFNFGKEGKESEEKGSKISRREFLKKAGALGAAGVLEWYAPFEEKRAWSKEVKEGDSFLRGIQTLRDDVLKNTEESQAVYIQETESLGKWASYNFETEKSPLEIMRSSIEDETKEIRWAHTHNTVFLKEFGLSQEKIDVLTKDKSEEFPLMPPSIEDILTFSEVLSRARSGLEQSPTTLAFLVVDGRGVWETTIDEAHPYIKAQKTIYEAVDFLRKNPAKLQALKLGRLDTLSQEEIAFIQNAQKAQEEWQEKYDIPLNTLGKARQQFILDEVEKGAEQDYSKLLESYNDLGFRVSFRTFDEVKGEEDLKK